MGFYEEQIQKLENLGKKESAGQFLGSNKLLYDLDKDDLQSQIDAWNSGKPAAQAAGEWARILRSLGFIAARLTNSIDVASEHYNSEYKPIIERLGFPEKICERTVCQLAVCEIGAIRKPTIVIADGHGCDADHKYTSMSLGAWFNIPTFFVDVPINESDKPVLAELNYVAEQIGELIEWAESTVPGVKYDEGKHIEMLEFDAMGDKYRREIWQLLKHIPSPIPPRDMIRHRMMVEPSEYPNMPKAVEYLRICRDEIAERVTTGKGLYPERLRLLWAGRIDDFQACNPNRVFTERGVAVPFVVHGGQSLKVGLKGEPMGEMSEYGIKLSPFQEEARLLANSGWGGPGKRWLNDTLTAAKAIKAEGIVHHNLIGCTPMLSMGSAVAERAEKELGIPTLNIEGRQMDREFMSQAQFDEIMSAFIDKCFDWAGKPRQ